MTAGPVAPAFGHGAEDRLADPPGQVLDRDGKAELGARPAEFRADRYLEDAETGPQRKIDQQDQRAADQDRGEKAGRHRHGDNPCGKFSPQRCGLSPKRSRSLSG